MSELNLEQRWMRLPCTICDGKRDWSVDGEMQSVCYRCGHGWRDKEQTATIQEQTKEIERLRNALELITLQHVVGGTEDYKAFTLFAQEHAADVLKGGAG